MTAWPRWHPRGGSLRAFLLRWLLGGLWGVVLLAVLWLLGQQLRTGLADQDRRLRAALAAGPQAMPAGLTWRMSTMAGEWLAGTPALASPAQPGRLRGGDEFAVEIGYLHGELLRVAARRVPGPQGQPAVLQVAAPWRDCLPGWRALWTTSPLGWVLGLALVLSGVIASGVSAAQRWLRATGAALADPRPEGVHVCCPSELVPAAQRMRELMDSQHRWVDEQRRFLADASHQLRTPMAVLRTQLQSAMAGHARCEDVLPQMLHTVDRAAGLANQLLSLGKVEQLKRTGGLAPIGLREVARDAVVALAPLVAAKRLDFGLEGSDLQAPGDPALLGELLRNLLANAIHHAPPQGRLGILLRLNAGRAEIVVWDEGPGIDDAVRPRLFQPFSAGRGGVGLGLSICRQIAEAMGAGVQLFNRVDRGQVVGVDAVVTWEPISP